MPPAAIPKSKRPVAGPEMRQIGTIADESRARAFADYLLTLDIEARIDHGERGSSVWIYKDEQVPRARGELAEFEAAPDDPKYPAAGATARQRRREEEVREREYRRKVVDVSGRWDTIAVRARPVTSGLIVACVAVWLAMQSGESFGVEEALLLPTFEVGPGGRPGFGLSGLRSGQVWRLITPIFLHFGIFHLAMNMWALWSLGGLVEARTSARHLALLVLISAVLSNVAQAAWTLASERAIGPSGGMSGVIFALFGYVWMLGRVDPTRGMILHPDSIRWMLIWLVVCMTGYVGLIGNGAHVGGLLVGMALGIARY